MDNFWAGPSHAARGREPDSPNRIGDLPDLPADDPLGDEAAFPSTWQHLDSHDAPHD
jgi:hypothetical protein